MSNPKDDFVWMQLSLDGVAPQLVTSFLLHLNVKNLLCFSDVKFIFSGSI